MFLQDFVHAHLLGGPRPGTAASRPIVWLIGFFAFLNVYSMQSVLPLVMHDFHASPVQAGATVGATVLAMALVSPFIGMLSDALGRKNVLCASLLALTIPTALIPLSTGLYWLVVLRFLQGLAVPGIVVVTMAYMAEEFRSGSLARMTTAYVSGTVMGGFSGRFITGHAGDLLGWRGGFLVLAILNFIGVVLVVKLLPPSQHFTPSRNLRGAFHTLGNHLRNVRLIAACAVGFCVLYSLVASFTYVNVLLDAPPFGLSAAGLANVFCVYLIGVVITPVAGRFIAGAGYQRALLGALTLAAAGIALTLMPSLVAVVTGLAICSTGIFICQSASIGFIAANVSEGRSLASGLYNFAYYSGGAVGAWLAGVAFEAYGWTGSVATIFGVQVVAAGIAWIGWRPVRKPLAA